MIAACIGQGAAMRRPDVYTKFYFRGDVVGTVPKDLAGHTTSGDSITAISTKFQGYAIGRSSYNVTVSDSADFNFGTSSFTVEAYVYRIEINSNNGRIWQHLQTYPNTMSIFQVSSNGKPSCYVYNGGSTLFSAVPSTGSLTSIERWYHVAFVRNGNTFNIYVDGVSVYNSAMNITFPDYAGSVYISPVSAYSWVFQDIQVSIGVAKYTGNFTPPTRRR